jgi:hypothetical protein
LKEDKAGALSAIALDPDTDANPFAFDVPLTSSLAMDAQSKHVKAKGNKIENSHELNSSFAQCNRVAVRLRQECTITRRNPIDQRGFLMIVNTRHEESQLGIPKVEFEAIEKIDTSCNQLRSGLVKTRNQMKCNGGNTALHNKIKRVERSTLIKKIRVQDRKEFQESD